MLRSSLPNPRLVVLFTPLLVACSDDAAPPVSDAVGASDVFDAGDAVSSTDMVTGSDGASTGDAAPARLCTLTQWEQMMLDRHNQWRASAEPAAKDMYRLYWDTTIAANAAAWVSSHCTPDWPHSPAEERTDIGGYDIVGENLHWCAGTGCADLPMVTDGSGKGDAQGWWDERLDYDLASHTSTGDTSHYMQMASSNVYAIGCATVQCQPPGPWDWDGQWWFTICQYGPRGQGYWVDARPYEEGGGGLVEPTASVWGNHPGLCAPAP